ncbi:MAG: hypothetical protein K2P57_03600 [Burkholderiales bacterium]|nr:hypothetical protein [Burkholderiales bacterium]
MTRTYPTQQEAFWAGEFGNEYVSRNRSSSLVSANLALFSKILSHTREIHSVIEFGANIGLNIIALKQLLPDAKFSAIEINDKAAEELGKLEGLRVHHQSILDFTPIEQHEFVLTKGVLIHINPDMLAEVYERLYQSSSRYVCLIEYYNPTPTGIPYRGQMDKLFKRDFAGEMLDRFKNLVLVNYGFGYHRDACFPQDDITWFLMEKKC